MVISGVLAGYTIKYQRGYSMFEKKLIFCMKINEEREKILEWSKGRNMNTKEENELVSQLGLNRNSDDDDSVN